MLKIPKMLRRKKPSKISLSDHNAKQMALGKKLKQERNVTIAEMEEKFVKLTEAIQITNANLMLRLQDDTVADANAYQTHRLQVDEIVNAYAGSTDIGGDLVKRIINVAAALKIPNGLEIEGGDDNSPERKYIQDFINVNQLNEGVCTELSKNAEKEGQCLTELIWDPNDNQVKIKWMSWKLYDYNIWPSGLNNMTAPFTVQWDEITVDSTIDDKEQVNIPAGTLSNDQIAFVAFNKIFNSDGTIEGSPSLGNVISRLDDIGNDLLYWRKSNKLYAHPTPAVQLEDGDEAESLYGKIGSTGWTLGQMLISSGKLTMVVPENFYETIKEAILLNLQLVSGATGLAVSWLGFPDLMSNRAVADSLGEPLEIVAANDITSWKSFYEQMFDNVIKIRNLNLADGSKALETGIIKPRLKPMSDRIWQQLTRFWMPAAEKKLISIAGFHDKIPGFNPEEEATRLKDQQVSEDARQAVIDKQQAKNKAEASASSPNNRDDIGQSATGNRRFNNEQG